MFLNDFSVVVPEGVERPGGYVQLPHGRQYTLRLRNNHNVPCDARVSVDGNEIGAFRINANSSIRLERPPHDDGRLTFYKADSKEGRDIGLDADDSNLGLVSVRFTPEKKRETVYYTWPNIQWTYNNTDWQYRTGDSTLSDDEELTSGIAMAGMPMAGGGTQSASYHTRSASHEPGGTGLSGKSNQQFQSVGSILYDYSLQTTINLRLVAKSSKEPRPLMVNANPIPPPV